jgi:hypothetical protein
MLSDEWMTPYPQLSASHSELQVSARDLGFSETDRLHELIDQE